MKWFAACQPLQLQAGPLDHTANASGEQKATSLVQLQTPSFRDLGGSLQAPLLHLQNIEGALGWYKPIERTEVTIFAARAEARTLGPRTRFSMLSDR